MLIRYCARATDSGFPVMVMVLSRLTGMPPPPPPMPPPSELRSSQLEMRIIAPLSCLERRVTAPYSLYKGGATTVDTYSSCGRKYMKEAM